MTASRVVLHEYVHGPPDLVRHGLVGDGVDALDHGHVVGHELLEADVDRPLGRQDVPGLDACSQHRLQARRPVPTDGDGVDGLEVEAGQVGHHRGERRRDRHGIAVGDDERRVREDLQQGGELLEVLG